MNHGQAPAHDEPAAAIRIRTGNLVRAVMTKYNLTSAMVRAIHTGEGDAIIDCTTRTEKALIDRDLMHPANSNLTDKGKEALAELKAAEEASTLPAEAQTPSADQATAIEGNVINRKFALGSLPKHADHPDVRAALNVLSSLRCAELTIDAYDNEENPPNTRGVMVEPRRDGRVAVYWLEGGNYRASNGDRFVVELDGIRAKMQKAGWTVEGGSEPCVFAWRPANGGTLPVVREGATVRTPRGDEGPVARLEVIGGYAQATVNGVAWPASRVEPVASTAPTLLPADRVPVRAGDLVESTVASDTPRTIRVRVDREPWPVNERSTTLSDGKSVVAVFTDSIRVVETSRQDSAPIILSEQVRYAIQCRLGDDEWARANHPRLDSEDQARRTAQELEALSPEWDYRVVEFRRTVAALPHPANDDNR